MAFHGMETPRTSLGDATYLGHPDFDISQEASFIAPPPKDDLRQQLRKGGGGSLRTPRNGRRNNNTTTRTPLSNRANTSSNTSSNTPSNMSSNMSSNMPTSIGGGEFTPLLKSATRNRAMRLSTRDPMDMDLDDAELTPVRMAETSMLGASRNQSFVEAPLDNGDTATNSSLSTPIRLSESSGRGPLGGNQLSLREQEHVIDKVEKENFSLKLKIHFLEEALEKAGPGFSEAALKENTELKVDRVTMQREVAKYKKNMARAEKELESYRQQLADLHEKARQHELDQHLHDENDQLRQQVDEKEQQIRDLEGRLEDAAAEDEEQVGRLRDTVSDLEAEIREKERALESREDEVESLRERLENGHDELEDQVESYREQVTSLEERLRASEAAQAAAQTETQQRLEEARERIRELEEAHHRTTQQTAASLEAERARASSELDEANELVDDLEQQLQRANEEAESARQARQQAESAKERAEGDLAELQDELANKSMVTKGLSRQLEEKVQRLQGELDQASRDYASLEKQYAQALADHEELRSRGREAKRERDAMERELHSLQARFRDVETDLADLQAENERLQKAVVGGEGEAQQREKEVRQLRQDLQEAEAKLAREREAASQGDEQLRDQYLTEMASLRAQIGNLEAEIRERDQLYDHDSEQWENDRAQLAAARDQAEEKAASLQQQLADRLRTETKEAQRQLGDQALQGDQERERERERHQQAEASLQRQVDELHETLASRQTALLDVRNTLSTVRDELHQTKMRYEAEVAKCAALSEDVETLKMTMEEDTESLVREVERIQREKERLETKLEQQQQRQRQAKEEEDPPEVAVVELPATPPGTVTHLRRQLREATAEVERMKREGRQVQERVKTLQEEIECLRAEVETTAAERDELESELARKAASAGDSTTRDQERVDLRTAKVKLDGEVRRLREETRVLTEQRQQLEAMLEEEMVKANEEEERLSQEILTLQTKLQQTSQDDHVELTAAKRTIRELSRRVQAWEGRDGDTTKGTDNLLSRAKPGHEGEGEEDSQVEVSFLRQNLQEARQKQLEYARREAEHQKQTRALQRQMAELERQLHEAQVTRLMSDVDSSALSGAGGRSGGGAAKEEVAELRQKVVTAHETAQNLRQELRQALRKARDEAEAWQDRVDALVGEKEVVEQALRETREEFADSRRQHERLIEKLSVKLEQRSTARRTSPTQDPANRGQHRAELEAARRETEALEHDVLQQHEMIAHLTESEASLRKKLERVRHERATLRLAVDKAQRQTKPWQALADGHDHEKAYYGSDDNDHERHLGKRHRARDAPADSVVAVEKLRDTHAKELRGMVLQMQWMQARWEREALLRADAAFAKRFLVLQLEVARACNAAQLRELERIGVDLVRWRPLRAMRGGYIETPGYVETRGFIEGEGVPSGDHHDDREGEPSLLLPPPSSRPRDKTLWEDQDSRDKAHDQGTSTSLVPVDDDDDDDDDDNGDDDGFPAYPVMDGETMLQFFTSLTSSSPSPSVPKPTLRRLGLMARFIVRAQRAAATWRQHEAVRQRIVQQQNVQRQHGRPWQRHHPRLLPTSGPRPLGQRRLPAPSRIVSTATSTSAPPKRRPANASPA